MATRKADSQGRIAIGRKLAGKQFVIHEVAPHELRVICLSTIPRRERWLFKNKEALESVELGLRQAAARQFSKNPPNLAVDAELAKRCGDE